MTTPMIGFLGIGAAELLVILAVVVLFGMLLAGGALVAFLVIRAARERERFGGDSEKLKN